MKGGLVKQVCRLLSSSTGAECRPASFFNDGGVRRIVTAAENSERLVGEGPKSEIPAAGAPKPRWFRPDPVTGAWMPETDIETQVTSSTVIPPPPLVTRIRAMSTDASEDKTWWTSMEELPDMDRHMKDL